LSVRIVAYIAVSTTIGVLLSGIILLGLAFIIASLIAGPSAAADPEGIGLVVLVLQWSVPGTLLGVCAAGLMDHRTTGVSRRLAMLISIIASGVVSGAVFLLIVVVAGYWKEFPLALIIPAVLSGLLGAGVFEGLRRRQAFNQRVDGV
jgi:hypothetical protein